MAIYFQVGGRHAYTADFPCCGIPAARAALLPGLLWRRDQASRLGAAARTVSQGEVRRDPALTLLFCVRLAAVLRSLTELLLSISLRGICVSLFSDVRKRRIDKQGRGFLFKKRLVACLSLKCVPWATTE